MDIKQTVNDIFEKTMGCNILEHEDEDYFLVKSISSVEFISLLVSLEKAFKVEFDDCILPLHNINTFNKLCKVIEDKTRLD